MFVGVACITDNESSPTNNNPIDQSDDDKKGDDEDTVKNEPTNVPPVDRFGQLSVDGNRIIDKNGKPVRLSGVSFFWSQWIGKYYTTETVKWLKDDWRSMVVRAALAVEHDGYLDNPDREKAKIITVVDAAIDEGLYVIIDWHDHQAENHLEAAKSFFGEMAQKYSQYPNVIYETYNEPLNVSWSEVIKPYHEAIIDTIRAHDPDNIIICGSRNWSQRVDEPANDPIDDPNVAYTLHFYASTHKKWLRDLADDAMDKGIAIFASEYGTTEASGDGYIDVEETNAWWDWMDENFISYCNWSIADKQEASSALKPGANTRGGWAEENITESGHLVRNKLIANNPPLE